MSNKEILQCLLKNFPKDHPSYRYIKLPAGIVFSCSEKKVKMFISKKSVGFNMKDDNASFDAWALAMQRWGEFDKVILSWERPVNPLSNLHYQRFIFRVQIFNRLFSSWFEIDNDSIEKMNDFKLESNKYYLSPPKLKQRKNLDCAVLKGESKYECEFVEGVRKKYLMEKTSAIILNRQFPVGLFIGIPQNGKNVFPAHKSAIDIWGVTKDKTLLLFELKTKDNYGIGIISQLLFYSTMISYVNHQIFNYPEIKDVECKEWLKPIFSFDRIKAIMLAPKFHPLIDEKIIEMLNNATAHKIEFKRIRYSEDKIDDLEYV